MDAYYSFVSPVDADDDLNRDRAKQIMRDDIMMMAGKVKGFFAPPFEAAAATAAETNYRTEDAVQAFNQISGGDSGVPEFQSIVGKIQIDDLRILWKFLKVQYRMMPMSEPYSYYVPWLGFPVDADDLVPGRLRLHAAFEPMMMRKEIMKMADKVKLVFPTLTEAAAMAADTNDYSVEGAVRVLRRTSGAGGLDEFRSIVGELPINELQTLEKLLREPYYMMLRSEMGLNFNPWRPEVKAASDSASGGGGDSFVTKFAGQGIGVIAAKVAGGAVFGAFDAPTSLKPLEKAAAAVGLMSVIGGMVVQGKKPGLSRAMVKFGSVAIALAMIVPMAGNLDNEIMAWVFGVLAAAIVALTVAFA